MLERTFRWPPALFVFCLCAVFIQWAGEPLETFAQSTNRSTEGGQLNTTMAIQQTSFDFGQVDEGTVVTHEFPFKNTGKAELRIDKVNPD